MAGYTSKIVDAQRLSEIVQKARQAGKRIVFTNGVFDLLHVGHIRYLSYARTRGDMLIVAINSDDSTRRIKGPKRPIIPQNERAEMVAALGFVDWVVIFDEDTPDNIIRIVRPDVHIKGGDYRPEELPEAGLVRALGGTVETGPHVNGKSTSITIARVIEKYLDEQPPGGAEA
ncbi:MAG: D-glycero-beta-D-manno-heptose 1-phosphate adenylyltransferase [Armatimonadetes bacterium]|nr:D-glycero-beta-D-manno-heptose 1-phosphate adenylyltransferase [Armatimonadota bacterium]